MRYRIEWSNGAVNQSVSTLEELAREYRGASEYDPPHLTVVARHDDGTDLSPSERDEFETILAAMEPG